MMTYPRLLGALCATLFCGALHAQTQTLDIPAGDLKAALDRYAAQTGVQLLYRPDDVHGQSSPGARGEMDAEAALRALLADTELTVRKDGSNAVLIFREAAAGATAPAAETELTSVMVTAQKRTQSAQAVPIAMTAMSAKTLDVHRVQGLQDVARLTRACWYRPSVRPTPRSPSAASATHSRRSASTSRSASSSTTSSFPATARPASNCSTWNPSPSSRDPRARCSAAM
nr:hypothetical protein [Pseudoduganella plicata]